MNDQSTFGPTAQLAESADAATIEPESEVSELDSLERFGTSHEACLLVLVLAGAAGEDGKAVEEIVERAVEIASQYSGPVAQMNLTLARYYLVECSLIEYVPRAKYLGKQSPAPIPYAFDATWRRTQGAEDQLEDVLPVLVGYLTRKGDDEEALLQKLQAQY